MKSSISLEPQESSIMRADIRPKEAIADFSASRMFIRQYQTEDLDTLRA